MAYSNFFEGKVVNVFDSNETNELGQFQPGANGELGHIRCELFVHGTLSGSERVRCKISLTSDDTAPYATSDWVTCSTFDDSDGSNDWLGWVRFDFNRENINNNETYYIWLESDSYTRNADTFYIGTVFDSPYATYTDDTDHSESTYAFQWFQYY